MTRPPCLHLTEDHLGAAKRLYNDVVNSKISVEDATRNAKHLERVSPPAAALLWQWLVAYRSQSFTRSSIAGLSIEETPLTDDEYEDRPQRKPR